MILPLLWLLLAVAAPAVLAGDNDSKKNNLDLGANYSHPLGNPKLDLVTGRESVEVDRDNGFYVNYERKLSKVVGLKFGFASNEYDLDVSSGPLQGNLGSLKTRPLTANLLFHPSSGAPVDFYFGGGFAYVKYGDIDVRSRFQLAFADVFPGRVTQLDPDDDKTWNTELGLNIKFGDSPLCLNLNGQYIKTTAATNHGDFKVDPINAGAALLIRW